MIWDVFPYIGEEDILAVRRLELASLDVHHVGLECHTTFSGLPRDLYLTEPHGNLSGFTVDEPPKRLNEIDRESFVRDGTKQALDELGAAPDDWLIFGDVDEIPTRAAVKLALERDGDLVTVKMPYHSLLATLRLPLDQDVWNHRWTMIGRVRDYGRRGFARVRERSGEFSPLWGGWHLSSMGGTDLALPKVHAFAHHADDWTVGLDANRLRELVEAQRDIADRFTMELIGLEELPECIGADPDRFADLIRWRW